MPLGVRRFFGIRFGLFLAVGILSGLFEGKATAMSLLLGFFVAIFPDFCFAKRLFRHHGAQAARDIARGFYAGEAMKFALTLACCAAIFCWVPPASPLLFFVAWIGAQITGWLLLGVISTEGRLSRG